MVAEAVVETAAEAPASIEAVEPKAETAAQVEAEVSQEPQSSLFTEVEADEQDKEAVKPQV